MGVLLSFIDLVATVTDIAFIRCNATMEDRRKWMELWRKSDVE